MKKKKRRIVELQIDAFSRKGGGLALLHPDDAASLRVETSFTVPGDVIQAELCGKQKGLYLGKLHEVKEPSPDRIPACCIHFGICGGCRLQHISYENQAKHKELFTRQCFEKLITEGVDFMPIITCDRPWHYRNKMEYTFSMDTSGQKYLGLVMEGTRGKVFDITECHIVNTWFTDTVKCVKQWWEGTDIKAYRHSLDVGSLRTLILREGRHSNDRMVILTMSGDSSFVPTKQSLESFLSVVRDVAEPAISEGKLSIFVRILHVGKGVTTTFYDMLLYGPGVIREVLNIQVDPDKPRVALAFDIGPAAFFQPNPGQTEKFYSLALRLAKIPHEAVVYDLYCGAGTLGLSISSYVKQVIGIEISPESSQNARTNAMRNACHNMTILSGAVRHLLHKLSEHNLPPPDVVMINPPRTGLDQEAMRHLLALRAPKILYISCDPISQAIDVETLLQNGYSLVLIQPVDQFPQTYHVENIVILIRSTIFHPLDETPKY